MYRKHQYYDFPHEKPITLSHRYKGTFADGDDDDPFKDLTAADLQKKNDKVYQEIFNVGMGRGKETANKEKKTELLDLNKKLEAASKGKKLSEDETKTLKAKIKELEDETMSSDEKLGKKVEDLRTELTAKIDEKSQRADHFQALYENTMIENQILDHASAAGAYNPRQVVNILMPEAEVRAVLDDKKKETGKYEVIIPTQVKVKEGEEEKEITKEMSVKDAVEHFFSLEDNQNLLKTNVVTTPGIKGQLGTDKVLNVDGMEPAEIQANLMTLLDKLGKGEIVTKV